MALVRAPVHGTASNAFSRATKIVLVPFSSVFAMGNLKGKETEYSFDWMIETDLDRAGVQELADVPQPGNFFTEFHELEDNLSAKQRKLRFFLESRAQNSQWECIFFEGGSIQKPPWRVKSWSAKAVRYRKNKRRSVTRTRTCA